ncbi:MAG: Hsp70 family protein, partial [Deltaproteobacteria bacterium]|nr:Hsp70 family protein [Deltaproteobacteria bacterium]
EKAKRDLSTLESSVVEVRDVALTSEGPLHLHFPVTRPQFAEMIQGIIERSLDTCRDALELSDIKPREINAVYLSGGTSYIPAVREAIGRFFGVPATAAVPPERAVVTGAAVYAALLHMGSVSGD